MALSENDKLEIREEVKESIKEAFKDQGMSLPNHASDHVFLSNLRSCTETIRKASIWTSLGIIIPGILALIWLGLKGGF